jgi:hypothetical protein
MINEERACFKWNEQGDRKKATFDTIPIIDYGLLFYKE